MTMHNRTRQQWSETTLGGELLPYPAYSRDLGPFVEYIFFAFYKNKTCAFLTKR